MDFGEALRALKEGHARRGLDGGLVSDDGIWSDLGFCRACGARRDMYHRSGCPHRSESEMLERDPEAAFREGVQLARAAAQRFVDITPERDMRAIALVLTKLDEAELWFTRRAR